LSELRIYLRRDSLSEGKSMPWVLHAQDGRIAARGNILDELADYPPPRRCHLVLAADLVTCLPAQLPDLPAARLTPLLPAAAEARSLTEAERLHVALLDRDSQGTSWLAVIDRAWITQTLARLAANGLRVDAALPESLLLPNEPGTWSALLRGDGGCARLGVGIGLPLDLGEPPIALRLAREAAAESERPRLLRLYLAHSMRHIDIEHWQHTIGCPVEIMPAWHWQEADWPHAPSSLNLLQGPLRPRHRRLEWRPVASTLAWGFVTLGVIHLVATGIEVMRLEREHARLRNELNRLATQVLPAQAVIVDPAWQIAARLAAMRSARGTAGDDALARLAHIGALVPAGSPLLLSLELNQGRIELRYASGAKAWQEAFLAALANAGLSAVTDPNEQGGVRIVIETKHKE